MSVDWAPAAQHDRRRIFEYLAERNPAAASRLADALVVAADSLAAFPFRGRPGRARDTRELSVVRPYVIVYEVERDRVVILRIWHAAQDRP